jgi:CheY-like chemotaxis protein
MSAEGWSNDGDDVSRWEALEAESRNERAEGPPRAPAEPVATGARDRVGGSAWSHDGPAAGRPDVTEAAPGVGAATSTTPRRALDHEGADILLADADHAIAASIAQAMTDRGWRVRHVDQGEQALDQFRTRPPDCFVFDYSLPGLGGLDLLRQIAESGLAGDTRLVVNSAQTQAVHVQRARAMGAHRFLDRPVRSPDDLVEAVAEQLTVRLAAGPGGAPAAEPAVSEPPASDPGPTAGGLFAGDDEAPGTGGPPTPTPPRSAPAEPDGGRAHRSAFGRGGGPPGRVPKLG